MSDNNSTGGKLASTLLIGALAILALSVCVPMVARYGSWAAIVLAIFVLGGTGRLLLRIWDGPSGQVLDEPEKPTYDELEAKLGELSERLESMETLTSYELKRGAEEAIRSDREDDDDIVEDPPPVERDS